MNLRGYFTILRPGRTLAFAAVESLVAMALLRALMGQDSSSAHLAFLAFIAPVILGRVILTPIEDALHRESCALLPGEHRFFARGYLAALLAVSGVLLAVYVHWLPGYPLPSVAAIAVTMLALPLFRDRTVARLRGSKRTGMVGLNAIAAACSLDLGPVAQAIIGWTTLAVALGIAVVGVRYCFDRRHVRARGKAPYVNYQTFVMIALGMGRLARPVMPTRKTPSATRGDWDVRRVDASHWAWLKVFFHLRYGRVRQSMRPFVWTGFLFGPVSLLMVAGMQMLMQHIRLETWLDGVVMLRRGGHAFDFGDSSGGTLQMMFLTIGLVVGKANAVIPLLHLPVSRSRYAHYAWFFSLCMYLSYLLLQFASMAAALLVLDAWVEHSVHLTLLMPFAVITMINFAVVPLALGLDEAMTLARSSRSWMSQRLVEFVVIMMVVGLIVVVMPSMRGHGVVPSAIAIGALGVVSAMAYRTVLRHTLLRVDLGPVVTNSGIRG